MGQRESEVIAARQELTALGYLEHSGKNRPDGHGVMQRVWRISPHRTYR
jgi:hypothetical protein